VAGLPAVDAYGMIATTEIDVGEQGRNVARSQGGSINRSTFRCIRIGAGAAALRLVRKTKPP